jgi:putative transcriptional regulator
MARLTLDPEKPPRLTAKEKARLAAMTDAKITKAAKSDPDNPPLTEAELSRLDAARRVREVRAHTGLSQSSFAKAFRINIGRLRDLEQGRTQPDSALLAYLAVIDKNPELVRRTLKNAN